MVPKRVTSEGFGVESGLAWFSAAGRDCMIETLRRFPGLDDDQLARQAGIDARQTVNQICRRLEKTGQLNNDPGLDKSGTGQGRAEDTSHQTICEVLLLLLAADKYPIRGNHDWTVAAILDGEALAKAETATASPDDPPEFAALAKMLTQKPLPNDEREAVYRALYDYFEPEASMARNVSDITSHKEP